MILNVFELVIYAFFIKILPWIYLEGGKNHIFPYQGPFTIEFVDSNSRRIPNQKQSWVQSLTNKAILLLKSCNLILVRNVEKLWNFSCLVQLENVYLFYEKWLKENPMTLWKRKTKFFWKNVACVLVVGSSVKKMLLMLTKNRRVLPTKKVVKNVWKCYVNLCINFHGLCKHEWEDIRRGNLTLVWTSSLSELFFGTTT